jgi:cell wall-associated NlpC family hydrolase
MNALPRALRRRRWGIAGVVGGSGLAIGGSLVAALAAASALFVALGGGGSTAAMALGPGNSCIASPVPVDTSQATPTGSNAPAEMFIFPSPQPPYGQYEGKPPGAIPADYLRLYQQAGQSRGIPWQLLAGVGWEELKHGDGKLVNTEASSAGAVGPMQFMPGTWREYAVDGDGDGSADPSHAADAIPAAADMLVANGARKGVEGLRKSLYQYNHADWYVNDVLAWAYHYANGESVPVGPAESPNCPARSPVPPGAASEIALKAVDIALRQVGLPYIWGAIGPDAFDCSGLVWFAYQHAGHAWERTDTNGQYTQGQHVPVADVQPGDLVFWQSGSDIYHVAMYIGNNQIVEAPRPGIPVRVRNWKSTEPNGMANAVRLATKAGT